MTKYRKGPTKEHYTGPQRIGNTQWCIAKNGGGYTQTGVAKGLTALCLFMIAEVNIHCQKNPEVGIRRIPAYTRQYTTGNTAKDCKGTLRAKLQEIGTN